MKNRIFVKAALAAAMVFALVPPAAAGYSYPQSAGEYVNDFAGVLKNTDKFSIKEILTKFQRDTGTQAQVVTLESLAPYTPPGYEPDIEEFADELYNEWKIGDAGTGKGILLLISIKDRQMTLKLGDSYGGLYNMLMQDVIKKKIVPNFKEGDYGRGIYDGVRAMVRVLTKKEQFIENYGKYFIYGGAGLAALLLLMLLASYLKRNKKPPPPPVEKFGGGSTGSW